MTDPHVKPTRRGLLELGWRGLAIASLTGSIGRAAQRSDGVLVAIHLTGGNDGNNMIVPLGDAQYKAYASLRGTLAIPQSGLLPVVATRNPGQFGFHPALTELRDLYNQGVVAVMANAGSTVRPTDHQYGYSAFLKGGYMTPNFAARQAGLTATSQDGFVEAPHGVSMIPLNGSPISSGSGILQSAAARLDYGSFPDTPLGRGFAQISAMLPSTTGQRTLFSVSMNGFDTHSDQLARQATLFRELSQAMSAFYGAIRQSGYDSRVTVYTDSEFSRSLLPNAKGGSEHGWGNHQLVMGGSVLGADIHGVFPDLTSVAPDGVLTPSSRRDAYLAALVGWAGIHRSELDSVLPERGNAAEPDLMG